MPRVKIEKDKSMIPRTMNVKDRDITTITAFAITTKSLSFKRYCEAILAAEAKNIRKEKKSLATV